LIAALGVSIVFLGIGRIELASGGVSVSAWSVSRTTFFFWLGFKFLRLARGGWAAGNPRDWQPHAPLGLFFLAVTLSLLPDFRQSGDYRYFFFGCAHVVMLVDLFSQAPQRRWLPVILGLTPLVLVLRGFADDPSILNFTLSQRFAFPLDHPNTAGYLFAMSIPLCAVVAIVSRRWWRRISVASCASQIVALILTFSRGAWLGWAASVFFLAFLSRKWIFLALSLLLTAASVLTFSSIQDRLVSMVQPRDDPSLRERLQLFSGSLSVGMENPLLGVGYGRGRLKEALRPHLKGTALEQSPIWHTHNVYLELLAGTGFLGLLTFLGLIGTTLLRVLSAAWTRQGAQRLVGFALAASWVAAIVAAAGDVPFYHHETRIFFFSLLGAAQIYYSAADAVDALPMTVNAPRK
jgi:O-antigen ligase